MSANYLFAVAVGWAAALATEIARGVIFPRRPDGKHQPAPTLGLGLVLALIAVMAFGPAAPQGTADPNLPAQGGLPWVLAAALVLFGTGLWSDYAMPRSKRHLFATIAAAALLFLGGQRIPFLRIPFVGNPEALSGLFSFFATVVWIVFFVSILEVCSMIPTLITFVAILIGLAPLLPVGLHQNFLGVLLCGVIVGAVLGRLTGGVLTSSFRNADKADVLVLSFLCATASLMTFTKGLTMASILLPFAVVTVLVVLLVSSNFDRSMLLRSGPR